VGRYGNGEGDVGSGTNGARCYAVMISWSCSGSAVPGGQYPILSQSPTESTYQATIPTTRPTTVPLCPANQRETQLATSRQTWECACRQRQCANQTYHPGDERRDLLACEYTQTRLSLMSQSYTSATMRMSYHDKRPQPSSLHQSAILRIHQDPPIRIPIPSVNCHPNTPVDPRHYVERSIRDSHSHKVRRRGRDLGNPQGDRYESVLERKDPVGSRQAFPEVRDVSPDSLESVGRVASIWVLACNVSVLLFPTLHSIQEVSSRVD
jgi:hypothetical protein